MGRYFSILGYSNGYCGRVYLNSLLVNRVLWSGVSQFLGRFSIIGSRLVNYFSRAWTWTFMRWAVITASPPGQSICQLSSLPGNFSHGLSPRFAFGKMSTLFFQVPLSLSRSRPSCRRCASARRSRTLIHCRTAVAVSHRPVLAVPLARA